MDMARTVPSPSLASVGIMFGLVGLFIVSVAFVAGPFAPAPSVGTSLGELAAEAGKAALRNWAGLEQPAPEPHTWSIDRILWVAGLVAGFVAVLCGIAAQVRKERRDLVKWAIGLGLGAVAVQLLISAMLLIGGLILVCAALAAITGCFG